MIKKATSFMVLFLFVLLYSCADTGGVKTAQKSGKKVISISTFEDRSVGTTMYRAFKNGIPSQIIEAMVSIPFLRVIDREEVIRSVIKNKEIQMLGLIEEGGPNKEDLIELGKMLNAEFVVSGFFMVLQNSLQISASVINIQTAEVVHTTSVTGTLNNFFVLQRQIAINLAEGLNIKLNPAMKGRIIERSDTKNLNAYLNNYNGEKKMETIDIIRNFDKEKELARMIRQKDDEEKKKQAEIKRQKELAEKNRARREKELADLRERERLELTQRRLEDMKKTQEKKKLLESQKMEEETKYRAVIKRMEELARRGNEKWEKELDTLKKMNLDRGRIARERGNAEILFKKAIELDAEYTRAKKNLAKLIQAIPMTL